MADTRFFTVAGPFTLGELAALTKAELAPTADPSLSLVDVAPLDRADSQHISFLDNRKYADAFAQSKAAAAVVAAEFVERAPSGMSLLISKDPYRTYAQIAQAFYPRLRPQSWVAPTAWVDPTAQVSAHCRIEPGAYIGARVVIADGCHIGANAVIGDGVAMGEDCIIGPNASLTCTLLGRNVVIYPGARIGQDGFGFAMGPQGHLKVPQLGRVVIGDNVEIGANSTIDRGAGPDTIIGDGCMIDNLVQIGHNVQMGRGCVIVSQVGISGSTHLGDFVVAAGQVGVTGHLKIGSGARLGAQCGVMRDVKAGETVGGSPAVSMKDWLRQSALLQRMVKRKDL